MKDNAKSETPIEFSKSVDEKSKESKTFCFFSAQYLPKTGGVERYTFNLARKVISHGHRAIVVTSEYNALPAYEIDAEGIEIYRVPSFQFMNGRLPLIKINRRFQSVEKKLRSKSIDYCIINTYFYPLSMFAARWTRKENIPALIMNHGSAWLMTGNGLPALLGQLYERLAVRLCSKYTERFFGVSLAAQEWMKTFAIDAEGIITNAVSIKEIKDGIDSNLNWRAALSVPADSRLVAFVGRMIPEKGVDPMIEAMRAIREKCPNTFLVMVGEGPLFEKYTQTQLDGVILLGKQPYSAVLSLLKQADVFCLPSRSEGFACTVLEAAALECPIVTTATGGSPQLLINDKYGLLLKSMDKKDIAEACIYALNDAQWRREAALLSRNRLEEYYTWDVAVQQLYSAFNMDNM